MTARRPLRRQQRARRRRRAPPTEAPSPPSADYGVASETDEDIHRDLVNEEGHRSLVEYYARQRLLTGGSDEWRAFSASLRTALPVTFRAVRLPGREAESDRNWAEGMRLVAKLEAEVEIAGTALPWCRGYSLGLSRMQLREAASRPGTAAAAVQRWLVASNNRLGLIVRQEVVSMLPAVVLGAKPGERVLDLCGAPGSKSSQLLEHIVGTTASRSGFLVTNDVSPERAYIIASKLRALGSSGGCFAVCTGRGQTHPVGGYDGVVCDVPCSGDGTLRKDGSLWGKWRPGLGLRLHSLQLQLALRAAALTRVGGRLVYSTCSFNPIENEAVVAALLRSARGALEVVDASGLLPGLECSPGLANWQVIDDDMVRWASYKHVTRLPSHARHRLRRSMFAPTQERPPHGRYMRFFPHRGVRGGGFFIALLRKVSEMPGREGAQGPARAPGRREDQLRPLSALEQTLLAHALSVSDEAMAGVSARFCLCTRGAEERRIPRQVIAVPRALAEHLFDGSSQCRLRLVVAGEIVAECKDDHVARAKGALGLSLFEGQQALEAAA